MPACQNVWFLWVNLFEFWLLNVNHDVDQFFNCGTEKNRANWACDNSHGLDSLASKLFVLFGCMSFYDIKQQLNSDFKIFGKLFFANFSHWRDSSKTALLHKWDAFTCMEYKQLHHLIHLTCTILILHPLQEIS